MNHINPANVIVLLTKEFSAYKATNTTELDLKVAQELGRLIREFVSSYELAIESRIILELDEKIVWKENEESEESDGEDDEDPLFTENLSEHQLEQALAYYRSTSSGTRTISSMNKRYRFIKGPHHIQQLLRYEKRKRPRLFDQHQSINENVYARFLSMREVRLPLHDRDLRRWALQEAVNLNVSNFRASKFWLHRFKKSHGIVSRKITKFVSAAMVEEAADIDARAEAFVAATKPHILERLPQEIFNADQSGFQKEIHSGRSLAVKGTKEVEAVAQSLAAITHSYTIMPCISAAGELKSPLFICMQEKGGSFPQSGFFQAPNIYATAHTSHMMTKESMKAWFRQVYFPNAPNNSLLLVDSWSSWSDERAIEECIPPEKEITICLIPAKTTPKIQPLDVAFFRTWKNFVRRFSDRVLLDNLPVHLYQRDNIIKLQSLVHNQFSASRFIEFIRYAWYASGFLDGRCTRFENPVEFCFPDDLADECERAENGIKCSQGSFIRCAHCTLVFCFEHFFVGYHYCK